MSTREVNKSNPQQSSIVDVSSQALQHAHRPYLLQSSPQPISASDGRVSHGPWAFAVCAKITRVLLWMLGDIQTSLLSAIGIPVVPC